MAIVSPRWPQGRPERARPRQPPRGGGRQDLLAKRLSSGWRLILFVPRSVAINDRSVNGECHLGRMGVVAVQGEHADPSRATVRNLALGCRGEPRKGHRTTAECAHRLLAWVAREGEPAQPCASRCGVTKATSSALPALSSRQRPSNSSVASAPVGYLCATEASPGPLPARLSTSRSSPGLCPMTSTDST